MTAGTPVRPRGEGRGGFGAYQTRLWQQILLNLMRRGGARLQRLSPPSARRFGTWLGGVAFRGAGRKRRRAEGNLRLAYGDALSARERAHLVRRVFEHFGRSSVEFLRGPNLTPEVLEQSVTAEGWEHVDAARAQGRGVVLVTAHLGNWEVLGRWLASVKQVPLTVVAREPENPEFAGYVRTLRENSGFAVLNKGGSARELLRVLKRGEAICLLADQNSGDLFVPFFGVPAGTVAGPASLALHTGAALFFLYCVETEDGFRVVCSPPMDVTATGDHDADVRRIMTGVNVALESAVRQYPDQWLWLHDRWKSAFEEKNRAEAWPSDAGFERAYADWLSGHGRR